MASSYWSLLATLCIFGLTKEESLCDYNHFKTLAIKHFAVFCGNVTALRQLEKCESKFSKIRAAVRLCGQKNTSVIQEACSSSHEKAASASWCILKNTPHSSTKELRDLVDFHKCLGFFMTAPGVESQDTKMNDFLKKCGPKIRRVRSPDRMGYPGPQRPERHRPKPPKRRRIRPHNYQQQQGLYQRHGPPVAVPYPGYHRAYRALSDDTNPEDVRAISAELSDRGARSLDNTPSPAEPGIHGLRAQPPSTVDPISKPTSERVSETKPTSKPLSDPKPHGSRGLGLRPPGRAPRPPRKVPRPPRRPLGRASDQPKPQDWRARSAPKPEARDLNPKPRVWEPRRAPHTGARPTGVPKSPEERRPRRVDRPKTLVARVRKFEPKPVATAPKPNAKESRGGRRLPPGPNSPALNPNAKRGRGARKLAPGPNPPISPEARGARKLAPGPNPPISPEARGARKLSPGPNPPEARGARELSPGPNPPEARGARELAPGPNPPISSEARGARELAPGPNPPNSPEERGARELSPGPNPPISSEARGARELAPGPNPPISSEARGARELAPGPNPPISSEARGARELAPGPNPPISSEARGARELAPGPNPPNSPEARGAGELSPGPNPPEARGARELSPFDGEPLVQSKE